MSSKLFRKVAVVAVMLALLAIGPEPVAAQEQPPKSQPLEGHYQAARAALTRGDTDKAKLEVKLALQDNPLDAASHFLLASLLERQGEHDQAIVGLQRTLTLHPTNLTALYNLGTMLLRRGEAVMASRLLENAVLIRSDHVPSYNNLAKAYFLTGLPELAAAAYEEALRRDASNAIALGNLARLAEGAGLQKAAAAYRRRLEALGSGDVAKPPVDAEEPMTLLATRPLATAAVTGEQPRAPGPEARPDPDANALREILRDLPHVRVERRGDQLTLVGWTRGPKERDMLKRILAGRPDVLDLTSDNSDDPNRMLEIDAIIFAVLRTDTESLGWNFLDKITTNFRYFTSGPSTPNNRVGTTTIPALDTIGVVKFLPHYGWLFSAAATYDVNIANASTDMLAILARPHLTTLNGTPATFVSGGEIVFKVAGNISGDIKPYPFGTTLNVIPTLLPPGEDGSPRVHVKVDAGRKSLLALLSTDINTPSGSATFDKVNVTSEAVVSLGQTLILSGLSQRESVTGRSGVPILMDIPILKYLFSRKQITQTNTAVIILLTPRDPAFWDERNRRSLEQFVEMRRAYAQALQGTAEDMRLFRERYPNWYEIPPNRFASHFFMMNNSEIYRAVSGEDLVGEDLDLELLGRRPKKK
jgi:Tfp pilus assembly protein PilF